MDGIDENAYNNYFNITPVENASAKVEIPDGVTPYTYKQFEPETTMVPNTTQDIPLMNDKERYIAEGNIDDIDQLGELLRKMLNAAWGKDWGVIAPEFSKGENSENPIFPQITYDTNNRESAENMPIKPKMFDVIREVVNGIPTGDSFNVYRQWFDNVIEFNFWGRTSLEARQIMSKFECIMGAYAGNLKRQGVSEVFFLKEVQSKLSVKYVEGIPMRCLMYYIRFERIQSVRHSLLEKIDLEVNTSTDTTRTQLSTGQYALDNINNLS